MAAADPAAEPPGVADAIRTAGERAGPALRALLTCSDLGLAVWDTGLRCVWANDVVGRYDGIPVSGGSDGHRIRRWPATPPGWRRSCGRCSPPATAPSAASTASRPAPGTGAPGPHRVLPPAGRHGRPPTRRVPAGAGRQERPGRGDRLAVISEAGARIGTTLDVMRTAQELADFSVPLLADYVTVDLTEAVRLGGEPLELLGSADGRVPTFRRAGVASVLDGTPESLWATGEGVYVPEASPFIQVLRSGRPLLQPRLDTSRAAGWTATRHGPRRSSSTACTPCSSSRSGPAASSWAWRSSCGRAIRPPSTTATGCSPRNWSPAPLSAWTTPAATPANAQRRSPCSAVSCRAAWTAATPWRWPPATSPRTPSTAREATGSTSSGCPADGRRSSSATWSDTASPRRPPWDGCARRYGRWPTSTSPRRTCSPAWTGRPSTCPRTTTRARRSGAPSGPPVSTRCTTRPPGRARWPWPGTRHPSWPTPTATSPSPSCPRAHRSATACCRTSRRSSTCRRAG